MVGKRYGRIRKCDAHLHPASYWNSLFHQHGLSTCAGFNVTIMQFMTDRVSFTPKRALLQFLRNCFPRAWREDSGLFHLVLFFYLKLAQYSISTCRVYPCGNVWHVLFFFVAQNLPNREKNVQYGGSQSPLVPGAELGRQAYMIIGGVAH